MTVELTISCEWCDESVEAGDALVECPRCQKETREEVSGLKHALQQCGELIHLKLCAAKQCVRECSMAAEMLAHPDDELDEEPTP